jgi:methylase of polypeptide subunit release factors
LPAFLRPGGILIAEVDPAQAGMLSQEIAFHLPGSHTSILSDYSGRDRVVITRSSNEHA